MAVPKYYEFYGAFLKSLKDGQIHDYKSIKQSVIAEKGLSDNDLAERLPSGKQTVFDNRIGWARTYLKKAGLIESPARALFIITEEGKKALSDADIIDDTYLTRYASFRTFVNRDDMQSSEINNSVDLSPEEQLEASFSEINASLADELMKEIMKLTPTDFEKLVVKLLLKMGYGEGIENAGNVTSQTNDGGIDGMIKEDKLGFSYIYIQAKQWATDRTVDRPEIHKFIGSLNERKATKGLFITTAKFSAGAKEAARNCMGSKVVLVDGLQLTKLMIQYNLGVAVETVYEVKRLTSDFGLDDF
jgi:restriction system protein